MGRPPQANGTRSYVHIMWLSDVVSGYTSTDMTVGIPQDARHGYGIGCIRPYKAKRQ